LLLCLGGFVSITADAQAAPAATAAEPPSAPPPAKAAVTGVVTIESDLQKADNGTGILTASGNVRIVYADQGVVATARQAQYFSREGRVVLSGDVDVVQGDGNSLRAERLVYLVDGERLVAEPAPGQQVLTLYRFRATQPPVPSTQP
jgi:lipopolysaccharide export system protein LptA